MESPADTTSDATLLAQYAATRAGDAFAQLVTRYVDLVYSTALRRVRDQHLAEDVTQTALFLLSRKAGEIPRATILAGWLYQTARRISADALKMKKRREHHERLAASLAAESSPPSDLWPRISPLLEVALDRLGSAERGLV